MTDKPATAAPPTTAPPTQAPDTPPTPGPPTEKPTPAPPGPPPPTAKPSPNETPKPTPSTTPSPTTTDVNNQTETTGTPKTKTPAVTTSSGSDDNNNTYLYVGIGGGVALLLALAGLVIVLRSRQAADDEIVPNVTPREYYSEQGSRHTGGSRKSLQPMQVTPTTMRQSMDFPKSATNPTSGSGPHSRSHTGNRTNTRGSNPSAGGYLDDEVNQIAGYDIRFDKTMSSLRIANEEIETMDLVASGGFGVIYRGRFAGEDVAIKKCLPDKVNNHEAMESFMMEIKLMSRLEHPNIVRFVGVAWTTLVQLKMITEFMPRGSVRMLLQDVRRNNLNLQWFVGSPVTKLRIAANVAEALVYLHTNDPSIIHRDLKSSNVLLSVNYDAKLTDFGTSRELSDEHTMTAEIGTLAWIAPEIMLGGHYTERADIYSFGCLLNELDLCDLPYSNVTMDGKAGISHTRIGVLVAQGKISPQFSPSCPPWVLQMGRECLSFDPEKRPTAMQLAYRLRRQIADMK